jgi:hypothetical protein
MHLLDRFRIARRLCVSGWADRDGAESNCHQNNDVGRKVANRQW